MVDLVLDACRAAGVADVIAVISPAHPDVAERLTGRCTLVLQPEQRGSGHALAQVPPEMLEGGDVLVLNGDSPLLRADSLRRLVEAHRRAGAAATLTSVQDPTRAAGRVLRRPDGGFERIVEHRDASPEQRAVTEINVGAYCFRGAELAGALERLSPRNAAGELYLTDVFESLGPVEVVRLDDAEEAIGVNDRVELAHAEAALRARLLRDLMLSGVTVRDPATTFVDVGVEVGEDTVIEPYTILRGRTVIGAECRIGPHAQISDSKLGDRVRVDSSWLDRAEIGDGSDCGPFSRLRPGTSIADHVHVGSFAELVRTSVASGSAVPHVSYLGDTTVGHDVNIGAGTITANYDGTRKNRTVVEDGAFIGVDTMLRAPVRVGRGAKTGAGAIVTRDVAPGMIAVGMPARAIRKRDP